MNKLTARIDNNKIKS